jgi:glutamate-1-semialdehyde 2,1-aminomutase
MVKGNLNKIKKEDGSGYTIKDQFVKEAWNSQDMRDIRLAMINGEKVEGCSTCYLQEESGRMSNRQQANNEWAWRLGENTLTETIKKALDNNGHVDNDLVYLDLRLGNLCNLKCRMCNPWNSSQIVKEHVELEKTDILTIVIIIEKMTYLFFTYDF